MEVPQARDQIRATAAAMLDPLPQQELLESHVNAKYCYPEARNETSVLKRLVNIFRF